MKKTIVVCIVFIAILVIIFSNISSFADDSPKFVEYDMDASDSTHYKISENIKIDNIEFKILGYELSITNNGLKNYRLNMEIENTDYRALESGYTFMLAYDDSLIKRTNCAYKDDTIIVVEIEKSDTENPNQIVIVDNKTLKIISTVNIT